MFTGEDLLVVYSKIWENPTNLPLVVGAIIIPIVIVILIARIIFEFYMANIQSKFHAAVKYIVLAVDIPKDNEQNLASVEQLFVNLTAIKAGANWIEKYFQGKSQLSISMELVSMDGYIQFLIRTPEKYKDLVSSSVYSQYPESEITLVDDYVNMIPDNIGEPDCPVQLWGTEFILEKPSAYPIKTYKLFEHSLSDSFNDPLTPLLEAFSRLGVGENAGLQIILTPLGDGWKKDGANEIKKFLGATITTESTLDKYLKGLFGMIDSLGAMVLGLIGIKSTALVKVETKMKTMTELTPSEKFVLEKMQEKLATPSFSVTMRYFYLAKREVYNRNRGVDSIKGAMSQFGQSNLNSFAMHGMSRTDVDYYFVEQRVRPRIKRLAAFYKSRSRGGAQEFFLSTEELATIYHFPDIEVKTPMLPKSMMKKSQPPSILPTILEEKFAPVKEVKAEFSGLDNSANNAIIKREEIYDIVNSLPGFDFNNKHYEEKFKLKPEQVELTELVKPKSESVELAEPDKPVQPAQLVKLDKYDAPENLPFIQD